MAGGDADDRASAATGTATTAATGTATVALSLGGLLAACGGGEVTTDVAAPAPAVATTTTTAPTTTVSTIDFDRPVVQAETALVEQATLDEVAALIEELRGQTLDVDAQVRRLAPFPDLAQPAVAQIMDIAVSLAPVSDGLQPSAARVRFRVPDNEATTTEAISDDFRALGWFRAANSTDVDGDRTVTDLTFRFPGRSADDQELRATIEGRPGVTVVDLEHALWATAAEATPEDGTASYFARLSAWQEVLPIPRAATLVEVGIETAPDEGVLAASYALPAADEATAVGAIVRSIGAGGLQLRDAGGEPPVAGPLELVDEDGTSVTIEIRPGPEDGVFEITATHAFPLTPLD